MTNVTLKNSTGDSLYPKTTTENITDFDTAVETATADKVNTSDLAAVATSGSYTDLSNTPSNVSEFTNDSGYLTAVPDEYVTETELETALTDKQDTLTFDTTPTEDSTNPVTSGGVYTAISSIDVSSYSVDLSGYYTSTETDAAIAAAIEEAIGNVESSSY